MYSVLLGDSSMFGGANYPQYPFVIGVIIPELAAQYGITLMAKPRNTTTTKETYTVSIYIPKGFAKSLNYKNIDKSVGLTLNIRSTKYDAFISGKEFDGKEVLYTDLTPDAVTELFTKGRFSAANLYAVYTETNGELTGKIVPLTPTYIQHESFGGYRVLLSGGNNEVLLYTAGLSISYN
jgi:hypothetical protein